MRSRLGHGRAALRWRRASTGRRTRGYGAARWVLAAAVDLRRRGAVDPAALLLVVALAVGLVRARPCGALRPRREPAGRPADGLPRPRRPCWRRRRHQRLGGGQRPVPLRRPCVAARPARSGGAARRGPRGPADAGPAHVCRTDPAGASAPGPPRPGCAVVAHPLGGGASSRRRWSPCTPRRSSHGRSPHPPSTLLVHVHLLAGRHRCSSGRSSAWTHRPSGCLIPPASGCCCLVLPLHALLAVMLMGADPPVGGAAAVRLALAAGVDPVAEQRVGAGVLWVVGDLVALAAVAVACYRWWRADTAFSPAGSPRPRARDAAVTRPIRRTKRPPIASWSPPSWRWPGAETSACPNRRAARPRTPPRSGGWP